jgi:hypothetical protein
VSFTYDPTSQTPFTVVRLLIPDTDSTKPIYSDAEINIFLYASSSQGIFASGQAATTGNGVANPPIPNVYSPLFAAALALDSIASNKARLAAISQILDVKLGHDAAAAALHAQAESYRDLERNGGHFAIAEMVVDQFTTRERIYKQLLRLFQG